MAATTDATLAGGAVERDLDRPEGEADAVLDLSHARVRGERHEQHGDHEQDREHDPAASGGSRGEEAGHEVPVPLGEEPPRQRGGRE